MEKPDEAADIIAKVYQIEPAVALDLRAIAPVKIAFAAPLRLRMADRAPADRGVLRLRDWDEVGDYFAVLRSLEVRLDRPLARRANAHVELTLGEQRDVTLGHGSLVRGWANGLDLDRWRTGLLGSFGFSGTLLNEVVVSAKRAEERRIGDRSGNLGFLDRLDQSIERGSAIAGMDDDLRDHRIVIG